MIKKETLLVLGAGANWHLDFPLGQELIKDIYRFVYDKSFGARNPNRPIIQNSVNGLVDCDIKNSELLARFLELSRFHDNKDEKYTYKDIENFANHLFRAQPSSIDFFLEKNPQYWLLAKICIIFCLSRHENKNGWQYFPSKFPSKLRTDFPNFGWYQYLWHQMTEGCKNLEEFKKNKIKIITFNYDRSLEFYLMEAIKSFFNAEEIDAVEVFNSIKIRHVYGKLGKFYWEMNNLEDSSNKSSDDFFYETADYSPWEIACFFRLMGEVGEYGMARTDFDSGRNVLSQESRNKLVKKFNMVADEIRTFYEAASEENKEEYLKYFSKAKNIYFLGFGYHEMNIRALGLEPGETRFEADIFGTALGKSDNEVKRIKENLSNITTRHISRVSILNLWPNLNVESFFRDIAPLE